MTQFENATVLKKANVYADGRCISHTVFAADGSRKTLGVMLPGTLTFSTNTAECIDINSGACRVRVADEATWNSYSTGQSFSIPANCHFEIDVTELLDYVCHYAGSAP